MEPGTRLNALCKVHQDQLNNSRIYDIPNSKSFHIQAVLRDLLLLSLEEVRRRALYNWLTAIPTAP